MPMGLSLEQIEAYQRDGFLTRIRAFDLNEVAMARQAIEALEEQCSDGAGGHSLNQFFRVNGHLVIPLLAEISKAETILDSVEALLGPNLLVWSVELFIKEPGSGKTVSWHQDLTYWGMGDTDDEVTAWIALSDVSIEAGCMRFIPGSHKEGMVAHHDTFCDHNLLSRGQEIGSVDESQAVFGALRPGEMSFHHGRCFHASGPNLSGDRRIGVAIRYVTPDVRNEAPGRDYAMLVRGQDAAKGWINVAGPRRLFAPEDLTAYDQILQDQSAFLTEGALDAVSLYQHEQQQETSA